MATNGVIPPEIMEEILQYRVPMKTLGRSKCVSKQWRTLISSPEFVKKRLDLSNRLHLEKLILQSVNNSLYTVDLIELKNNSVSELKPTRLRFLPPVRGAAGLVDGLTAPAPLLGKQTCSLMIVNPTTQEYVQMSPATGNVPPELRLVAVVEVSGVGYDSLTDDYKCFSILRCGVGEGDRNLQLVRFVTIHSLRRNSWRVDIKRPGYFSRKDTKAVYLNGCFHWLCLVPGRTWLIGGFNLQNEEFEEMRLPHFVMDPNVLSLSPNRLVLVNGCLCVVSVRNDFDAELWLMVEYGVMESLRKFPIRGLGSSTFEPLYFLNDQEFVLKIHKKKKDELLVYNVEERTLRQVTISGVPTPFKIVGTRVESLVSPKNVNTLEGGFAGLLPATIASSSSSVLGLAKRAVSFFLPGN